MRIPRPAGGPGPRRTVRRDEHPGGEGDELRPLRQAAAGPAAPGAALADPGPGARRRECGVLGDRAAAAGRGHQPDLRRRRVQGAAARGEQGRADRAAAGRGGEPAGGHAQRHDADARRRDRLHCPVLRAAVGAGAVCAGLRVRLDAGVYPQRRRAAHRVPAARADRGEDQPAAAALLRLDPARRAAQPGDQRRRQHLAEPAAVHQPGGHLGADRGGRAGDDVSPLAHAGADCAGDHSADAGDDGADRQALAEAVRGAVEAHRGAERADRGDLHRARAGEGVRPAARGGGAVPAEERGAVPGQLRRAVHFRADHAGHDVHREPGLCGDRRGGRPAGGVRGDAAGRRAGVHPVLAAVHPAAGPAGLDGEPAAVRRGLGRAGVRAAGRRTSSRRILFLPWRLRAGGGGWCSRTCRSPIRRTSR